jgi:hypothetical protein
MAKIEYEKFSSLEKLEFKLFKELNIKLQKPINEETGNNFNLLFSSYRNDFTIIKVLKLIDDNKVICSNDSYFYVFENTLNLNTGEIICLNPNNSEIFKIGDGVLDDKFLEDCRRKLKYNGRINEESFAKNTIIKKEHIEKRINKIIEEDETRKKEELEEERADKDEEFRRKLNEKKYNQKSIFEQGDIKVDKSMITMGSVKFVLTKDVNEIFDYSFIGGYYTPSETILERLIKKEEEFTFYQNNKQIYELKFEKNKKKEIIKSLEEKKYYSEVKINGVRVRRNKILYILNRIDEKTTKKDIKLWSKFTKMQEDLMNLKEFSVENIPLKIDISYYNKDLFLVNLFGKKEKLTWDNLDKFFFGYGRSIYNYFTISDFMEFTRRFGRRFGFTKQDVYDKLKELKEKNETKNN